MAVVAPTFDSVTVKSSTRLDLAWTNNDTYDYIHIFRKRSDEPSYSLLKTMSGSYTSYSDTGLLHGTTYSYKLRGDIGGELSDYSNVKSGTTILPAPSNTSATKGTYSNKIVISWTNGTSQSGVTTRIFYAGSTIGPWYNLCSLDISKTSYAWSLPEGTKNIYFKVGHSTSDTNSAFSNKDYGFTYLPAPTNLTVNQSGDNCILNWTINSTDQIGTKIERRISGETWSQIDTVSETTDTYTDTDSLSDGVTYEWRVRCYTDYRNSDYSNTASLTYDSGSDTFVITVTATPVLSEGLSDTFTVNVTATPYIVQSAYTSLNFNYYLGGQDGKLYLYSDEYYGDNGQSITCIWESKLLDFDMPGRIKTLTLVRFKYYDYSSHDLTMGISIDDGETWQYKTKTIGSGDLTIKSVFFDWWVTAENFKIRLIQASSNKRFAWIQMEVEFIDRGEEKQYA